MDNATPSRATAPGSHSDRQALMRSCAMASTLELEAALAQFDAQDGVVDVRRPEVGLVMLRGRIGGDGAPFNAGEATMTRAVVRLATGEVGYSYLLGRDERRARLAAIVDALGQSSAAHRAQLDEVLVGPVTARAERERAASRAETAATRVNFFTLVRGED